MVKIQHQDRGQVIKLAPVDKLLDKYLAELEVKEVEDLTFGEIRQLFLRVIDDFKAGKVNSDALSLIGRVLFFRMTRMSGEAQRSKLFDALQAASELGYYIRNMPPEGKPTGFDWMMWEVMEYYESEKG